MIFQLIQRVLLTPTNFCFHDNFTHWRLRHYMMTTEHWYMRLVKRALKKLSSTQPGYR